MFVDSLDEVPDGLDAALLGARRLARNPPRRPRAEAAGHRRHLPAGDQGPSRSGPLRQGGLHDPAHRPRGARRSDRHDGRSPAGDRARRIGRRRRPAGRSRRARSWPISRRRRSRSTTPTGSSTASRQRFPQIVGPPKEDICYATQNRQEAVRMLAAEADLVLVLGSQNSSNSQRLKELAREHGVPAYLIDGAGRHRRPPGSTACETVVITAGASAPESVVEECVDSPPQPHSAPRSKPARSAAKTSTSRCRASCGRSPPDQSRDQWSRFRPADWLPQ